MFLDYSVFGNDQGITIANDVSIKAEETVGIFSFDEEPKMPELSTTTIILDPSLSINEISDTLIFSEFPITNGTFEATNIYIGNYSSLKPVPLPASLLLFVSGIAMVGASLSSNRKTGNS